MYSVDAVFAPKIEHYACVWILLYVRVATALLSLHTLYIFYSSVYAVDYIAAVWCVRVYIIYLEIPLVCAAVVCCVNFTMVRMYKRRHTRTHTHSGDRAY